jgi:hypothetical protein
MRICMDIVDIHGYPWISMDIYGPPAEHIRLVVLDWISILDIRTYPCTSIHIHESFLEISTFYIQKSYLCIIHAVIHQGIHTYPYSTLHIHVYSGEIYILDIQTYPCSISML